MSDPKSFAVGALIRPRVYVCVCLSACEEEVFEECQECLLFSLGRSDGGRLLCFMVLGTADLSLTPVSRGHVVQKKKKKAKQRDVCVCECTF